MSQGNLSVQSVQSETNYNILSENIDFYNSDYSFPFKAGDTFPTAKLKERADRSFTNRLLFNNDYEKVFGQYLSNISDFNQAFNFQLRDIVAQLPFFSKVVSGFIGLTVGNDVLFDFPDVNDDSCDMVVNSSNIRQALKSIIEGDFMDACNLYKVSVNNLGKPVIQMIPTKNFIVFNDPKNINSIYSYLTFSINGDKVEFIEYLYDGTIIKRVFNYDGNALGSEIEDEHDESVAFNGKYKEAPVVLFSNNVLNLNDTYGCDRFSSFDSSILAVCRSFSNLLRLSEKCGEIMKKVPDSAVTRNAGFGMFINRGTVTYPDNTEQSLRPDVEYIYPELKNNIEAEIEVFKQSVKALSMASCLSDVFFDFEKAGAGALSGKALEALMMPTLIEVNKICNDKEQGVKELVRKLCLLAGIDTPVSKIDVDFNQGLPKDEKEQTEIVSERLSNRTISLVDAIRKLDRVPLRVAKEQANVILGLVEEKEPAISNEGNKREENNEINEVGFNTTNKVEVGKVEDSGTIPDYQMPVTPRDLQM